MTAASMSKNGAIGGNYEVLKEVDDEDDEDADGIDFIEALSDRGDQENDRALLTTKARLFGEDADAEGENEEDIDYDRISCSEF